MSGSDLFKRMLERVCGTEIQSRSISVRRDGPIYESEYPELKRLARRMRPEKHKPQSEEGFIGTVGHDNDPD